MDLIKMEPEVDPLAIQTNDNTDVEKKEFLSEGVNSLNLHSTRIKKEPEVYSCDLTSDVTFGEIAMPNNFQFVKCEIEEELCELDRVKEELKFEVTAEEDEIFTESLADTHDNSVSSECGGSSHEEHATAYHDAKESLSSANIMRTATDEKEFVCDVCGKCFSFARNLKRHVLMHTGEKPFSCDVCGKLFMTQAYLNRHRRLHTGQKPFKCDICEKCFSQSPHLKSHKRQHTGEKPFKCDVCGKCFSQSGPLRCHKRQHTGEKPFKCDVCEKCFSQSSCLKSHKRRHTGEKPFKCNVCGKCFSQSGQLIGHERQHTGEKPFKCDVCGKVFAYKNKLRSHVVKHIDNQPFS
ncbi:zinc finger protein 501-like isoform X3 [Periplaneta americana]|uniref:zinc finger protein 501-like isoform X3 n=1 Tax=Periplaneta americana TaxID=6978 RepID=UPI0037E91716